MSLRSGLISEYHLDTTTDTGSNGFNLTTNGAPTLTTDKNGVVNKARNLSSGNNYHFSPINWALYNSYTMSCWVKNGLGAGQYFLYIQRDNLNIFFNYLTVYQNKASLVYASGLTLQSTSVINDNVWHLVTTTYDGSNVKMYVDGKLETSVAHSGTVTQTGGSYTTMAQDIGYNNISTSQPYVGSLDELKIYNRALTSYEIYQLYIGYDTAANQVGTLRSGLVAEYHLDTLNDTSGNNINLTNTGTTLTTDKNGVVNKARLSNGTQYLRGLANTALNTQTLTASVWIKITSYAYTRVINYGNSTLNTMGYILGINPNGTLRSLLYKGSWLAVAGTSVIPLNTWTMITMTYDGSNRRLYVNGQLEVTFAETGSITYGTMSLGINTSSYTVGELLNGSLDELKIYNRALSDTEILMLYYGYDTTADSIDTLTQGLIAGYHLDTLNDISGNGNTLINSGTILTTDKLGVANKARNFNGVTSTYLNATTITNAQLQGSISFNAWINPTTLTNQGDIFSTDNYPSVRGFALETQVSGYGVPNTFVFMINTASGLTILQASPNKLANGVWAMVTGTWNSSTNSMNVYVNGVLDNASFKSTAATGSVLNNASTVFIGRGTNVGQPFNGVIDEPRIYVRELTEDEIIELNYNYDVPTMSAISAPPGYSKKVNGITPGKVNGVAVANISKVNGI